MRGECGDHVKRLGFICVSPPKDAPQVQMGDASTDAHQVNARQAIALDLICTGGKSRAFPPKASYVPELRLPSYTLQQRRPAPYTPPQHSRPAFNNGTLA